MVLTARTSSTRCPKWSSTAETSWTTDTTSTVALMTLRTKRTETQIFRGPRRSCPPPETPQETEFLTPPDPPKDDKDDREAVADRAAETPVDDVNNVDDDAVDNGADDNGNRLPHSDVATNELMPGAENGVVTDDAGAVDVVVADDNANDITPLDDVANDAGNRMRPDVVSDGPNEKNDSPRVLNGDNGIVPNDIFVDDDLDYDSKKADRQSNAGHDLIVQDA
ncbi:hypothetical protein MRX96_046338 [Rhipicephalus microplus]